jgi:hypothetical protein
MRVENFFRNPQTQAAQSLKPPHAAAALEISTDSGTEAASQPPTELQHFLALVRQEPEIRKELLQKVSSQLASGAYLTSDAAEQTAKAIEDSAG